MKRRNQRTAIILIISLLIGLFCQGISNAEPKDQASSYQLTEGEAVENYSFDLDQYQNSFTQNGIFFDFRKEYEKKTFNQEKYSALHIVYEIEYYEEKNCSDNDWFLNSIKFGLVTDPEELTGYYDSSENLPTVYLNKTEIGMDEITISFDPEALKSGTENEVPIVGLNIQLANLFWGWPEEVKAFTVTGLEFVANKDVVYPSAPATMAPTQTQTPTPVSSTTQEPVENNSVDKIANLQTKVQNKKNIMLSWNSVKKVEGYEIFRSTKKNSGYQKIAVQPCNKDTYTDSKIKRGQEYYYKVRAYVRNGTTRVYGTFSDYRKQMVRRQAPSYTLKKGKTPQGTLYVQIRLKSWADSYLEIWVRWGKKNYMKIPLSHKKISKKKRTYYFKYSPGKRKMWFQIKTYRKNKGKKQYSYTKTKRI